MIYLSMEILIDEQVSQPISKMNRLYFFAAFGAFALSGCVSSSNLFQDGHTAGKGEWDVALSASYNFVSRFDTDTTTRSVDLEPYKLAAPWLQLQAQYGLAERLDVGGGFGVGLFTFGLHGYSKLALLSNKRKFGVSLLGLAGFAELNEEVSEDGDNVTFSNLIGALPMSYDFGAKSSIAVQPMVSWERYVYRFPDPDGDYRKAAQPGLQTGSRLHTLQCQAW